MLQTKQAAAEAAALAKAEGEAKAAADKAEAEKAAGELPLTYADVCREGCG